MSLLSNNFPESGKFISSNPLSQIMQIVSNLLGGMGAVFGLLFVVSVSDILVSYVAPSGKTMTEIITERVVQ